MNYFLNQKSTNNYKINNFKEQILSIRDIQDIKEYCNPIGKYENHYSKLKNINSAISCFLKHINNNNKIVVIIDEDTDGFTSSAILISYILKAFKYKNIQYIFHTRRKSHGLSDDIIIPSDTNLIIIPDAGSSDYEKHKELKDLGMDIIVLDHHETEIESENAIVVNNQIGEYPNKSLSGVGIVYKFLQALDEELWLNYADNYLDLVALGLIGDNMDVRNLETRYYIFKGLKTIKNKQLKALIDKQAYKIHNNVNMTNIAFYIVPLVNGMIRVGKQDEKELMFRGFLEDYIDFDYMPRGGNEFIKESIYERVSRLAVNTKSRQDKLRDKAFVGVLDNIKKLNKDKDKILVVNCNKLFDTSLTGVVAIKIANKYNKPCLLLRKKMNSEDVYGGSARNTGRNEISDLKAFVQNSGYFELAEGHPQAFGVMINKSKIPNFIEYANKKLKNVNFESNEYQVDFIIPFEDLQDEIVYEIDLLKNLWSKGIEEPLIAITDVEVKINEIQVLGKTSNTLKFNVDGLDFIKFFIAKDERILSLENKEDILLLDIVGKCSSNIYKGEKFPQIIIEDYEIKKR